MRIINLIRSLLFDFRFHYHKTTFNNRESLDNFIKNRQNYGINDLSIIPDSNSIIVLDIKAFESNININKLITDYGQQLTRNGHSQNRIQNRFREEPSYRGTIQEAWDQLSRYDRTESGQNLRDVYELATNRIDRRGGDYAKKSEQEKRTLKQIAQDYEAKFRDEFEIEDLRG